MGDFVMVEDVANELNMTQAAIRALIRRGELPAFKLGKEWRINKDDLAQFVESARVKPAAEVEEETRRNNLQRAGSGAINVEFALDNLDTTVCDMADQDSRERLVSYSVIRAILAGLDERTAKMKIPIGNYISYKKELMWSCEAICGLNDGNGHDAGRHVSWALGAIIKLKSFHCFNIANLTPTE